MYIVYMIDSLTTGGAQRQLEYLIGYLRNFGFRQEVVVLNGREGGILRDAVSAHADLYAASSYSQIPALMFQRYLAWRRDRPDVLQTMLPISDTFAVPFAATLGIPLVRSIRGRYAKLSIHSWLDRGTQRFVSATVCNGRHLAEFAEKTTGVRKEDVHCIPNGVPTLPPVSSNRHALGIRDDAWLVVCIGRLHTDKGQDLLLRAFSVASRSMSDAQLVLVGDGPERDVLGELARSLGIQSVVEFCPYCSNVYEWLAAADLFVQASRTEGMPNAVMEAMAAGCEIVATDVGATSELLNEGECGILVPPESIGALAAAIADRRAVGGSLGPNAQEQAKHYSVEKMANRYLSIFETVMRTR